ncbi:adenylyltransferase/cytidyltransferase family protein [bacterium]|nr:adenylyltransferase/cytidyltransferase family protein [bacterium]
MMTKNKIKTLGELKKIINQLRKEKNKIILTNGCFDLLHVGHIRYLEGAGKKGDVLIVAINNDLSIKKIKDSNRPIIPQNERARIIAGLECVDFVVLFSGRDVSSVLLALKPDIHLKGTDYTPQTVPEREVVFSYGGKVGISGDKKKHATRDLIKLILRRYGKQI